MKFAIKCSYVDIEGIGGISVVKDPITDLGKRSKPGRLKLVKDLDGSYRTISSTNNFEECAAAKDQLVTVFENGKLLQEYSLETIRANCDIDLARLDFMHIMHTTPSESLE
jgi:nicotinamide phosphoribosyltransferase